MEALGALAVYGFLGWLIYKVSIWLWPFVKFGAIFLAALTAFGAWIFIKELSWIGVVLGVIAAFVGAYKFAKSKT